MEASEKVLQSPSQRVIFAGGVIQLAFFILHITVGIWTGLQEIFLSSYVILLGVFVWGLAWAHGFLKKKALFECQDLIRIERLKKEEGSTSKLFQTENQQSGNFQQNLKRFERFLLPGIVMFLGILHLLYGMHIENVKNNPDPTQVPKNLVKASAFFLSFSFLLIMAGLYFREQGRKFIFMRGPSTQLFIAAVVCGVHGTVLILHTNDLITMRLIPYFMYYVPIFLLADYFLSALIAVLKPSHPMEQFVPAYDLKLSYVLTSTGLTFKSLSDVLYYQFGFKVSEDWFSHFFVKKFFPYLLFLLFSGLLSTSFVFINSNEGGVLETFGKVNKEEKLEVLEPGFYIKFPWPIQKVQRFSLKKISVIEVGHENHQHDKNGADSLNTSSHYKDHELFYLSRQTKSNEFNEIVAVSAQMRFEPDLENLYDYVYGYKDLEETSKQILFGELTKFFAGKKLTEGLATHAQAWSVEFEKQLFAKITKLLPGVNLLGASIKSIHYPAELHEKLREVYQAKEQKNAAVLKAHVEASYVKAEQESMIANIKHQSDLEINQLVLKAKNDRAIIENIRDLYKQYRSIFIAFEKYHMEEKMLSKKDVDFIPKETKIYLDDKSIKRDFTDFDGNLE